MRTIPTFAKLPADLARVWRYAIVLLVAWTTLASTGMAWIALHERQMASDMAIGDARVIIYKDLALRHWAMEYGGLYAVVSERNPPNPALAHVKDRDVPMPSGGLLTLIPPARMVREISDLDRERLGFQSHLVAIDPTYSKYQADEWEAQAIAKLAKGAVEVSGRAVINGEPSMRIMLPLIATEGCLKCHAAWGFKVGHIRGGVSASVPLKSYSASVRLQTRSIFLILLTGWVLGLGGILFGANRIYRRAKDEIEAEKAFQESQKFLSSIFDSIQDGISILDRDLRIVRVNAIMEKWYAHRMPLVGKKCFEAYHGRMERCEICPTVEDRKSVV